MKLNLLLPNIVAALGAAGIAPVMAQSSPELCGALTNGFGPYDYRTDRHQLPIVESAHFTPVVEMLIRGSSGYIGSDLDYTLRAFPNHHRALVSITRYAEKTKSLQPPQLRWTVECYFERATRFRPDDTVSRMLFAQFLYKLARPEEARAQLQRAAHAAQDNPVTYYNVGLVYAEAKDYPRALEQAHRAMAMGLQRDGLRQMLAAAGQWKDPEPAATAPAASTVAVPPAEPASAAKP